MRRLVRIDSARFGNHDHLYMRMFSPFRGIFCAGVIVFCAVEGVRRRIKINSVTR
jgi:hypothetical protein